jgi:hypothetical protein
MPLEEVEVEEGRGPYHMHTRGMNDTQARAWWNKEAQLEYTRRSTVYSLDEGRAGNAPTWRRRNGVHMSIKAILEYVEPKKKRLGKHNDDECASQWYRQAGFPA